MNIKEKIFINSLNARWLKFYLSYKYRQDPDEKVVKHYIDHFIIAELNVIESLDYTTETRTLIFDKITGKILEYHGKINLDHIRKFCVAIVINKLR